MNRLAIILITTMVWLYCGIAFFDPANSITGIKFPVFAAAVLLSLLLNLFKPVKLPKDLWYRLFFLVFLIPAIWLTIYIIQHPGQNLKDGLSLTKGLWAILLILPVITAGVDLKKPVFLCIGIMTASIIGLRYCAGWDPARYERIAIFLNQHSVALVGFRNFGDIDLAMVFFVATPLVILAVPFLVDRAFGEKDGLGRRFSSALFLLFILVASYFAAARALSLVLLLECLVCFVFVNRRHLMLVTGTVVLAAVILMTGLAMILQTSLLSADEQSNSIKIAHFESFIDFVNDHPAVLLTGDGLGATYYSRAPGVNQEVYQTELTYVDMVRYFGLAGCLFVLLVLFLPLFLPADKGLLAIGLGSYFIVAGNNPLLLNSTGMLAIVFFWSQQIRPDIKLKMPPNQNQGF